MKPFAFALAVAFLASCNNAPQEREPRLPSDVVVSKAAFANQRFLPTNTGDLAFDTKSGSLCKTWDWPSELADGTGSSISNRFESCSRIYEDEQRETIRHDYEMERLEETKLRKAQ